MKTNLFGKSATDEAFEARPWLLDEGPNDSRAGEFGMTRGEYEHAWRAAGERLRAAKNRAANDRAIEGAKFKIRLARHTAELARSAVAQQPTLEARKRVLDAEFAIEEAENGLRYMLRGSAKSDQRRHFADAGIA